MAALAWCLLVVIMRCPSTSAGDGPNDRLDTWLMRMICPVLLQPYNL